jgi:ribosomal protein S18 acetylase RimI-like enzyme
MNELTIRPAQPSEAQAAGQLLMHTLYGFGVYQTGLGSAERGAQVLSDYFKNPGNRFSYEFSRVACLQGNVTGLLLAFPGILFAKVNRRALLQMPRVYSLGEIIEFFRRAFILKDEEEVARDEYYIAHLAVIPAYRRKGIGRRMLQYAQEQALQAGLHKLSLMAELENQGALALYEGFGFTTVKIYQHPHQIPLTGSLGYVKMVKEI